MAKLNHGFELNQANHNTLVRNLLKRTREFSPQTIEEGSRWYPSAAADAIHVGEGNKEVGAAILSKVSPQQAWGLNRQMGLQLVNTPSSALNPLREAFHNKIPKDDLTKVREDTLGGTPLKHPTTQAVLAADNIRTGRNSIEQSFSFNKTGSNKTGDFALTIAGHPNQPPIDTHAYDAALDRYDIDYGKGSEHMKTGGAYSFVQSAYAKAHQQSLKQGLIPKDMSLGDYQATHWLHHQLGKASISNRVEGTARSNIRLSQRHAENNPVLNPATHGLEPLATEQDYTTRLQHFNAGAGR